MHIYNRFFKFVYTCMKDVYHTWNLLYENSFIHK